MNTDEIKYNRLKESKSPYLKSHKSNPIDWFPWGEEAFNKAVKEDKLIFLSIGYSSCRWCHKMNRESFSNIEIAEILNENYVSIKVDKEERPDIDKLYMLFSEALTGITGWPLNIILTPDRVPIFSGNFMTVDGNETDIGLKDVLINVNTNWNYRREDIVKKSRYILLETDRIYNTFKKDSVGREVFDITKKEITEIYDWENGGYFERPKFLLPQYSLFLFKYYISTGDDEVLDMAIDNLTKMYRGSIFDHIGGGFFRYSTSDDWNSPHFEKMLGENAMMAILYTTAYQATGNQLFKEVTEKIFKFLMRDMMSNEGAFYTSIDAEFEGEEGKNYFFTDREIIDLLGETTGNIYIENYNIFDEGRHLPNLNDKDLELIKKLPLDSINDMLYEYRVLRGSPKVDKKILSSMNGVTAGALAYGGSILKNNLFVDQAKKTMDFIISNMVTDNYEITPIYMDGEVYGEGVLLDYSYVLFGLINLYISTSDEKYLEIARRLSDNIVKHFWNEDAKALYLNKIDQHDLILNLKDNNDGSMASSSGVMAYNWLKLYKITGDSEYYMYYRNMINSYSGDIIESPNAHIYSIISMFFL